jgi:hypothetical protein
MHSVQSKSITSVGIMNASDVCHNIFDERPMSSIVFILSQRILVQMMFGNRELVMQIIHVHDEND